MAMTVTCPDCGTDFKDVPEHFAGRKVRCRQCGSSFLAKSKASPGPGVPGRSGAGKKAVPKASTPQMVPWRAGDVILNLYEVIGILGEGGMGTVYRVHHRGWNMDLAVKSPKPKVLSRSGGAENFEREAETWVNLGLHPHAVSCYYVRRLGGVPRVFAEFIEGGSLSDWIKNGQLYQGGPEPVLSRILDIAIQFAWGLDYSHEQGLIHQDVKPANVMMTRDGLAKVTDFGLARARPMADGETGSGPQQTMMVASLGMTPAYASPEQATGGTLTRRTDLWSWGVSLLEMFTGEVLWPMGTTVAGYLEEYLKTGPENKNIPMMPPEMADLLRLCFKEDPDRRPRTMEEAAAALAVVYGRISGRDYPRTKPQAGKDTADSLNNRAVSLLDLGKRKEAEEVFARALATDAHHIETNFNLIMSRWKNTPMADDEVFRPLLEVGVTHKDDLRFQLLLGRTYLFFKYFDQAIDCLQKAAEGLGPEIEDLRDMGLALGARAAETDIPELWQKAGQCFQRLRELGQEDALVIAGEALALKQQGLYNQASDFYQEARTRHTDLPADLDEAARRFLSGQEILDQTSVTGGQKGFVLAVGQDGRQVVFASVMRLIFWELDSGRFRQTNNLPLKAGQARVLALTRDLGRVLTGGADEHLRYWETATGRQISLSKGQAIGQTMSLCLSPDGSLAMSGNSVGAVLLWDVKTGQRLKIYEEHSLYVSTLDFSPDGNLALSGSGDGGLNLWEPYLDNGVRRLEGHQGPVTQACFSPRGSLVVSCGQDRTMRLWEVKTGRLLAKFIGHTATVTQAVFHPKLPYILSIAEDNTLRLWNMKTARQENIFRFEAKLEALAVTPDGRYVILGKSDVHTMGLKNLVLMELDYKNRFFVPLSVTMPKSAAEATAMEREFRQKMDEAQQALERSNFHLAHQFLNEIRSIPGYERDPEALTLWRRLSRRFANKGLRSVWKQESFKEPADEVWTVAFLPPGDQVLSAGRSRTLGRLNFKTGEQEHLPEAHQGAISCLAVERSGRWAVSGGWDNAVCLWDLKDKVCARKMLQHRDYVTDVDISADGRLAISASRDQTLVLWDLNNGEALKVLKGHQAQVTSVVLGPDNMYAVSGDMDGLLCLWDLVSGKRQQVLKGHMEGLSSVALAPDGIHVATGGFDHTLRYWSLAEARLIWTCRDHPDAVQALDISPDGHYLITGCREHIRFWDLRARTCLHLVQGHNKGVVAVAFSPDGQYALSAGQDKVINLWYLDQEPDIREFVRYDKGALGFLETFLVRQTPYDERPPQRTGRPQWSDEELRTFLYQLYHYGYGWIEPFGVESELKGLARKWTGPIVPSKKFPMKKPNKFLQALEMVFSFLLLPLRYYWVTLPVLTLAGLISFYVFTYANPYAPDGFRDVKFNAYLHFMKNMVKVDGDSETEVFTRKYENLFFHGIQLSEVKYIFRRGRLKSVQVFPKTDLDWNNLYDLYEEKYGRGNFYSTPNAGEVTVWVWNKGSISLILTDVMAIYTVEKPDDVFLPTR